MHPITEDPPACNAREIAWNYYLHLPAAHVNQFHNVLFHLRDILELVRSFTVRLCLAIRCALTISSDELEILVCGCI